MKSREAYLQELRKQLDRWNDDITRWEKQANAARAEARRRYEEDLEILRDQRQRAAYNLRLLEKASAAAWQEFAAGAEEAWAQMREAAARARSHFQKQP